MKALLRRAIRATGYELTRRPRYQLDLETAALKELVSPGSVVYDIGANRGELSAFFASLGARVFSFEPVPTTYTSLAGRAGVVSFPFAIGETDGDLPIWLPHDFDQNASFAETEDSERFICPVRRLDSIKSAFRLPTPDLIKIDVEGAEPMVLRGAEDVLSLRPLVFMELFAPWLKRLGFVPWDSLEPLAKMGYSFLYQLPTGFKSHDPTQETPFHPDFSTGYNVLAYLPEHDVSAVLSLPPLPMVPAPIANQIC